MIGLLGIQDQSLGEWIFETVNNIRILDLTPVSHESNNLTVLHKFEKHSSRLLSKNSSDLLN